MAEGFDHINAPQFLDFNEDIKYLDDSADEYFDQVHEDPLHNSDFSNEITMLADDIEEMQLSEGNHLRRSMSVGDIQSVLAHIHKLRNGKQYAYDNEHGENENENNLHSENSYSTQSLNCKAGPSESCGGSSELINRLAQPKRKFKSELGLETNDYVPMAEALKKFQHGTPKRFRTRSKATTNQPLKGTIAYSPKLKTAQRSRPVDVKSQEELEQLALAEARKSQFKAHPFNKKILEVPSNYKSKRKMSTVPQPFNLTEAHSKEVPVECTQKVPEFHARPVPKSIYEPYQHVIKPHQKIQPTKPHTPTFLKKSNSTPLNVVQQNQNANVESTTLKPTKPKPFSFEARDTFLKTKREARIQKYIEAEKKAREFHAKPIPKFVREPINKMNSTSNLMGTKKMNSEENLNYSHFKAKPPKVLYQKPFVPQLPNRPLLELQDFTLNTDLRAKQRENFEHQIREKEEKLALLRQEEEMMKKREEMEETIKARKMAEFKAQEIKKYKEIQIQPVKKVTNPVSPKFCLNKLSNKSGNKENTS